MPCENCNISFTDTRRYICARCRRYFCRNCLVDIRNENFSCEGCVTLAKKSLTKRDLMRLSIKNLLFYIERENARVIGHVEKEVLVDMLWMLNDI